MALQAMRFLLQLLDCDGVALKKIIHKWTSMVLFQ